MGVFQDKDSDIFDKGLVPPRQYLNQNSFQKKTEVGVIE